jgi:hypothetical protein
MVKIMNKSDKNQDVDINKPTRNEKRLSNLEFFKLCEELRNRREVLTTECPKYTEALHQLEERLGFGVPTGGFKKAMEATGVTWTPKKALPRYTRDGKPTVKNSGRILTKWLVELYEKMGEPVPELLKALLDGYKGLPNNLVLVKEEQDQNPKTLSNGSTEGNKENQPGTEPYNQKEIGTVVFKVGDVVYVDGSHFTKYTVLQMRGNGRYAILDNNHEVQVSRLNLAQKAVSK